MFPDLQTEHYENGRIVQNWKVNRSGSDYLDLRFFHNLGGGDKLGARRDNPLGALCPLSYLEIYNPYFVTLSRESLEKMMALMRPTFDPVRLLQDEYLHCALPRSVCTTCNGPRDF